MKRIILTGAWHCGWCFKPDGASGASQAAGPQIEGRAGGGAGAVAATRTGPDAVIKAAEDLLTKFADTDFKDVALLSEAEAWQQKRDFDKAQVYAERALEANPRTSRPR